MIGRIDQSINWQELKYILKPSDRNDYIVFEEMAKIFLGVPYCCLVSSGRQGIYAVLKSNNISDAEVVLPAYTCTAVVDAVVASGNRPQFVDINLDDYNIDLNLLEQAFTHKTGAVVLTSLFGIPINLEKVKSILSRRKILVINDCALAYKVYWKNEEVWKFGDYTIFSMNNGKLITGFGGGIVTTTDRERHESLQKYLHANLAPMDIKNRTVKLLTMMLSLFLFKKWAYKIIYYFEKAGIVNWFICENMGKKMRMPGDFFKIPSAYQLRLASLSLKNYEINAIKRRRLFEIYTNELSAIKEIILPPRIPQANYSHYVVRIKNRSGFRRFMEKNDIHLGQHFNYVLPYLPVYRNYAQGALFPHAEVAASEVINLPFYPSLREADAAYITRKTREYYGKP